VIEMAKGKEVAVQSQGAVAFSQETPTWLNKNSARGSENVGTKDIALPRLEIVQAQSPIKDVNEDAREGMFFNSVTQDVLGDKVFFVPVYYRMEYLVWKDQDSGGGFFGAHESESEANARIAEEIANDPSLGGVTKDGRPMLEAVDTPVHYGLMIDMQGPEVRSQQLVISMPKSKAKVSRKWNSVIQMVGGDRFSRVYALTTFKDKNKQNKTFFNFVVQPAGFPPESIYREAERLYEVFRRDGVKADHASVANQGEEGTLETDPI
jgi:hypothetical protein